MDVFDPRTAAGFVVAAASQLETFDATYVDEELAESQLVSEGFESFDPLDLPGFF